VKSLVIFIHGTWVDWWALSGNDFFAKRIREALREKGADEIEFHNLDWSVNNSMSARAKAAAKLRTLLSDFLSEPTSERVLIIAHSHGGNVALQASIGLKTSKPVSLFCIATPFIFPMHRLTESTGNISIAGISVLIAAIWSPPTSSREAGLFVVTFIIGFLALMFSSGGTSKMAKKLISEIHSPSAEDFKTLSLYVYKTLGDEISAFMGASQVARIVCRRLIYSAQKMARFADSVLASVLPWAYLAYYWPEIRTWFWPSITHVLDFLREICFQHYKRRGLLAWAFLPIFLSCALFGVYPVIVAFFFTAIVITSMIVFGFDAGIVALHCELGVADAPTGISTFRIVDLSPKEISKLDHTEIYGTTLQDTVIADVRNSLGLPSEKLYPSIFSQRTPEIG
jgi:hypothetical protein